jgi:hypothetical protein
MKKIIVTEYVTLDGIMEIRAVLKKTRTVVC